MPFKFFQGSCMLDGYIQWLYLKGCCMHWQAHCWTTAEQSYINDVRNKHWTQLAKKPNVSSSIFFFTEQIQACVWTCLGAYNFACSAFKYKHKFSRQYHSYINCINFHRMLSILGKRAVVARTAKTSAQQSRSFKYWEFWRFKLVSSVQHNLLQKPVSTPGSK